MVSDSVEHAANQWRQDELVITTSVFTSLSILVVAARVFVRAVLIRKFGADDATISVALLFCIAYLVEILLGKANGIGHAMSELSLDNMLNLLKASLAQDSNSVTAGHRGQITLAIQLTYYGAVTFIKLSILCMYLRFVVTETLRKACIGILALQSCFFVVCVAVTLAQCRPLHKMWDLAGTVTGTCINTTAFFYFTSGFNIITDIIILALPIKTLLGINRPGREKIALICVFGVGTFATIVAIVRLHTIYTYTLADDLFKHSILVNLWSIIEINVAVVCASVPALKPLFTPKALMSARQGSTPPKHSGYEYHSRGRSGIKSKVSVDQSFAARDINLGPIVPSSSTKISGGKVESDSGSMQQILTD